MEVILQEDYAALGYIGDQVQVRPGFARNFLIPRGIAIAYSKRNVGEMAHRLVAIHAKKAKLKAAAEEEGKKLSAIVLSFTLKFGKQGKSFGTITTRDIEAQLLEKGFRYYVGPFT